MKHFTPILAIISILAIKMSYGQITFSGCHPLFDNQSFTMINLGPDDTGRNSFETTPITGDNPCSGVGVCEFRIVWNDAQSRWEFLADDGTGDFSSPYLVFYNAQDSTPNPPSLILGFWEENTTLTGGVCGGSEGIVTLTGEVQDTLLSVNEFANDNIFKIYPNPSSQFLNIEGRQDLINQIKVYEIQGKELFVTQNFSQIDISHLTTGVYFVELQLANSKVIKRLIKD
jgi:hypothetical protein